MTGPVPFWKSDPDYFPKNSPDRKKHLEAIAKALHLDKLVSMASADSSYSVTVK